MQTTETTRDRTANGASPVRAFERLGAELHVVSNRQPYRHEYASDGDGITVDEPAGGLTAALDGAMRQLQGSWIAWGDGDADAAVVDRDGRVTVPPDAREGQYDLERVWLDDEQVQGYYYGFSNRVLWPICHSSLTEVDADTGFWEHYREVNEQFADAVRTNASDRSVVWLQDYHLALAPHLIDAWHPGDPFVAHTWHVPWPDWSVFRACPHRRAILRGLLGNDLLTFHVPRYCENFLQCAATALPDARVDWETNRVIHEGGTTTVRAFPMGVDAGRINREARSQHAERFWPEFAAEHDIDGATRVAVGVDRLDYSKGIPERFAALERLWERDPRWRESLSLVQIGTESRSDIPAYARYQETVAQEAERINERFGTDRWTPIVYTTAMLEDEELAACYRNADLGLVSPIRDGMNLVAQEYVAAQQDDDGVLVLSDQAGAHDELGEWVVSVRPFDLEGFAAAIDRALTLPPAERRSRMRHLRTYVARNDLNSWIDDVLRAITVLRQGPHRDTVSGSA